MASYARLRVKMVLLRPLGHGVVAAALLAAGCDRKLSAPPSPSAQNTPTVPATVSATTAPSTRPASVLEIDGKPVQFPPALLMLTKRADGVTAVLFTDDPPAAINAGYPGNSFYLDMRLDIADPADIASAQWKYKSPTGQPDDSTNGIFLNGAKRQLLPVDVTVTFDRTGDEVTATINGKFLSGDAHSAGSTFDHAATVTGTVRAALRDTP